MPHSETGTATAGISATRQERKNKSTTSTTKAMAMANARSISRRLARMVGVRSITTSTLMALGMDACNCGSKARTLSTASMMLALGALFKISKMEGLPLATP